MRSYDFCPYPIKNVFAGNFRTNKFFFKSGISSWTMTVINQPNVLSPSYKYVFQVVGPPLNAKAFAWLNYYWCKSFEIQELKQNVFVPLFLFAVDRRRRCWVSSATGWKQGARCLLVRKLAKEAFLYKHSMRKLGLEQKDIYKATTASVFFPSFIQTV